MEILVFLLIVGAIAYAVSRSGDASNPAANVQPEAAPAPSREAAHLRSALQFTQQKHAELSLAAESRAAWQKQFGEARLADIDAMTGIAFEQFLAGLFRIQGYAVETTATSGDFGADLILVRGDERLAVQAKRWKDAVGVGAVQEALSGKSYYACSGAWVITTSRFTPQAQSLAAKAGVRLIDRSELALPIGQKRT